MWIKGLESGELNRPRVEWWWWWWGRGFEGERHFWVLQRSHYRCSWFLRTMLNKQVWQVKLFLLKLVLTTVLSLFLWAARHLQHWREGRSLYNASGGSDQSDLLTLISSSSPGSSEIHDKLIISLSAFSAWSPCCCCCCCCCCCFVILLTIFDLCYWSIKD